jgi:hypothetical protein
MHDPRSPADPSLPHSVVKASSPVSTARPEAEAARSIYSHVREKSIPCLDTFVIEFGSQTDGHHHPRRVDTPLFPAPSARTVDPKSVRFKRLKDILRKHFNRAGSSAHRTVENRDPPQHTFKCWRAPSDAIHRLGIDNDDELRVFETAKWQAVSGKRGGVALGRRHRERVIVEPPSPTSSRAPDYTFLADSRTDAFSFNFEGIKNPVRHQVQAEFHRASPT